MFNLQGFSAQKAPVADGNVAAALGKIRSLLTKLLHSPETGVLELTNDDSVNLTRGMIVAISNDTRSVVRADSDDTFPTGFAICLADAIVPNASGYFRFAGEAEVLLIDGLAPDEPSPVNVSATAGFGTDQVPAGTLRRIGLIVDASDYVTVTSPFVRVILEPCCLPIER